MNYAKHSAVPRSAKDAACFKCGHAPFRRVPSAQIATYLLRVFPTVARSHTPLQSFQFGELGHAHFASFRQCRRIPRLFYVFPHHCLRPYPWALVAQFGEFGHAPFTCFLRFHVIFTI